MVSDSNPVVLPNAESLLIDSSIVNDTYKLFISLPMDYNETEEVYPVVYATDGGSAIFELWNIVNVMRLSQQLPPLIIVGIGYSVNDPTDFWMKRSRDFDPFPDYLEEYKILLEYFQLKSVSPGGASAFLRFIREELKPYIKTNYRVDTNDSTYVGISAGGLFGLYSLFQNPDTFNRYVIGSPNIHRGNNAMFNYESNYAAKNDDLPIKMFLSVASREETDDPFAPIIPEHKYVSNVKKMATILQERNYPNLELTIHVFEGETHLSVIPATYSRGLRTVFK